MISKLKIGNLFIFVYRETIYCELLIQNDDSKTMTITMQCNPSDRPVGIQRSAELETHVTKSYFKSRARRLFVLTPCAVYKNKQAEWKLYEA